MSFDLSWTGILRTSSVSQSTRFLPLPISPSLSLRGSTRMVLKVPAGVGDRLAPLDHHRQGERVLRDHGERDRLGPSRSRRRM